MNLQNEIEELIYTDADDLEISRMMKDRYKLYQNSLKDQFHKSNGKSFLVKHTKIIDDFLKTIYKFVIRKYFGDYTPLLNSIPISLFALGSYGREELSIYSDIDLMIVYEDIQGYLIKEIIESILSMAWDSGFKLGHRVHKVDELLEASRLDHTIKTAMIEARFICGSKFLSTKTSNQISHIRKDRQIKFIQAKIDEYYHRHDTIPIEMRADIKNGAGGLRDFNTLFWIANTLYGVQSIGQLLPHFNESDYVKLMKGVEYLFKIRIALHLVEKKKCDRIRLESIPEIAALLGLTQKKCAQKLFKSLNDIKSYTHIFITQLTQELLPLDLKRAKSIDENLFILDKKLYAKNIYEKRDTLLLLDKILNHNSKIDFYNITFTIHMNKTHFENFDGLKNHIIKKLFYSKKLYHLLVSLYYAKVIMKIIPPLLKVRNLPQFDGYHRYPVDLHSLYTIEALESIDDSFIKNIYESFNEREKAVLRLATLLHDCGKGRKRDHSILGANIVKSYAKDIGFEKNEQYIAYILVRYHTLMSNTASREDIYNEKVIYGFISKVRDPLILKMLYVLTYCDIESVGRGTYSNFNANLLKQLYHISLEAFNNNAMINEATKRAKIENRLKKSKEFLSLKATIQKKILRIESNLLFFKYQIDEIIALARWIEELKSSHQFLIRNEGQLIIEILSRDPLNVGYLLGKLSFYDIVTMDIFKIESGLKYFKVEFEKNIDESEFLYIKEIIENSFDMSAKTKLPKLTIKKSEIDIYCEHSSSYARMKVNTIDQRGLVANIIAIFDEMGIDIASAKIQTMRNRARNLFLIEKNGLFCQSQDEIIKQLTKA